MKEKSFTDARNIFFSFNHTELLVQKNTHRSLQVSYDLKNIIRLWKSQISPRNAQQLNKYLYNIVH